jgi:hypothetical protein
MLANPAPWWSDWDRPAVSALAWAQATIVRYREYLNGRPVADGQGRPVPAEQYLLRWERHAEKLRSGLGLTSASRQALMKDASIAARLDSVSGAPASGLETLRARGLLNAVESAS